MGYVQRSFIIILLIFSLSSCTQKHQDPFYNDMGDWDSAQLPLVKPYYLIYIEEKYGWQMPIEGNFPQEQYYYNLGSLLGIEKVAVEDGVIMIYTPVTRELDKSVGQTPLYWFVMIPAKGNLEIGFDNEDEFLSYIQAYGTNSPSWVDPNTAYREFSNTGCFHWIPDCK